ncbi:hypothetical protein MTsPCn9_28100 [Croceitalea sp. MTPC9]|uniref:hypothetical protein n=1 Tax=unclassified Croceitalea TaxID=2632280 RepID=UPI002B3B0007|nr:hypothetical protein MTsPCn6_22080 [Croceitalea sp. MTPC6]GMN17872.1 hypothetical protein MTsPCn9_28100 [Croceitalea sp. MTPC9]
MKNKKNIFKIMYIVNILGAGVPGFLIVFFPSFAEQYVLWAAQDYGVMTILGSIWLAIGLTSIIGIFLPYQFLGIFIIQLIYKTLWLTTFILPAVFKNEPLPPGATILIGIFIVLILEVLLFLRPSDFKSNNHIEIKTTTNKGSNL